MATTTKKAGAIKRAVTKIASELEVKKKPKKAERLAEDDTHSNIQVVAESPETKEQVNESVLPEDSGKRVLKELTKYGGISYYAWNDEELGKFPITTKDLGKLVKWAEYPSARATLLSLHAADTPTWKDGGMRLKLHGVDSIHAVFLDAVKSKTQQKKK